MYSLIYKQICIIIFFFQNQEQFFVQDNDYDHSFEKNLITLLHYSLISSVCYRLYFVFGKEDLVR